LLLLEAACLSSVRRLHRFVFPLEKFNPRNIPMTRNRRSGYSRMLSRRSFAPIAASILVVLAGCKEGGSTEPKKGPTTITLDPSALTVKVGQTGTVYSTVRDEKGARMPSFSGVTWSSANSSVASVAKSDTTGVVTGLAVGDTQILATIGSTVAHISVTVVP
jgi:Big-like domain-containing protein